MKQQDDDAVMEGPSAPEEEKLTKSQKKRNKKNKKKLADQSKEEDKKNLPAPEKKITECDETIDAMWESDDDGFDIDAVIEKLLSVSKKNPGTLVNLE